MSPVGMREATIDTLIQMYVSKAETWVSAAEAADSRRANRASDRLEVIFRELMSRGEAGWAELRNLLGHPSPSVRYWAVSEMLDSSAQEAIRVWDELVRSQQPGPLKVMAGASIDALGNGTYRFRGQTSPPAERRST